MKKKPTPSRDRLREAILDLAAEPTVDSATLDRAVHEHPALARELTAAAVDLALGDALARTGAVHEEAGDPSSPAVRRGLRAFHDELARLDAEANVKPDNPFLALDPKGVRELARRVGMSSLLVAKLRDRRVLPETIPSRVRVRMSDVLDVPPELLAAHFAGKPELPRHAEFKADERPEVGPQQSFEDAVRSSGLTPAEQARLLEE